MIYVFFANGFEEVEAIATVDVLRRCGIAVKTVGVGSETITGAHGVCVVCDTDDTQAIPDHTVEAVVLPGGMPGTLNLEKSEAVQAFLDYASANEKYICAICAAPSILGHKGLLQGKRATCFPGFEDELEGAEVVSGVVCTDGRIITGKGAGSAIAFGFEIAKKFVPEEKVQTIWKSLQCQ